MSQKWWTSSVGRAFAAIAAISVVLCPALAKAEMPQVSVELRFESSDYRNLSPEVRNVVKEQIEPALCSILHYHYPFLRWTPSNEASANDVIFVAALYDDALKGVSIQYEAYIPEQTIGGSFDLGSQVMSAGGLRPRDANSILKKIRQPLIDHVRADDFKPKLFGNFVSYVRVARELIPVSDAVVVPVSFTAMNADGSTRLNVDVHGDLLGNRRNGRLSLTPIRQREDPPHAGETEADVLECPGISDAPSRAPQDLARLMKAKRIDTMNVTVGEYKRLPRVDTYGNARFRS